MKRAIILSVFVASLVGAVVYATQGMQDDLDGLNTYSITGLKQVAAGTETPDPNATATLSQLGGVPPKLTLLNDLGLPVVAQQVGMRYSLTTDGTPTGPNNLIFDLPVGGFVGKQAIFSLNGSPVSFLGAYTVDGALQSDVMGLHLQPAPVAGTGYTWFGATNDSGLTGVMAMSGTAVTKNPFSAINDALWLWNPNGPICLGTNGSASVASTCGVELDGSDDLTVVSLATAGVSQCVQADTNGKLSITGSPCGAGGAGGGSGTVTSVTGTPPIFITASPTVNPNVTIQGSILSGSTSTTGQDLGAIATSMLACSTSAGVCTVDGVTVGGGLNFNVGTATETLASFTCGAGTFVNSSSTSGLACSTPSYPVTSVTGTNGVTCSPTTGAASCTIANFTCSAGQAVTAAASGSGLSCSTFVGAVTTTAPIAVSGTTTRNVSLVTDSTLSVVIGNLGVDGINDGSGAPWLSSGTWTNGKALGTVSGGIQAVSFQAPIAGNTCGSNTFATSISTAGALTCTQPAFSNLSGSLACGQLPALGGDVSSAGGTCSVGVIALEETSGPARLAINAIPDLGSPFAGVLNRPGGTGTVVGSDSRSLLVADKLNYYVTYTLGISGATLATSSTTTLGTGGSSIEYGTNRVVKNATLCINLITNGIVSGSPTFAVTRNGTNIGGGLAIAYVPGVPTGLTCTSQVATGSTSAADTYGLLQATSSTGTITLTATVILN